jgi:hypothetical protein
MEEVRTASITDQEQLILRWATHWSTHDLPRLLHRGVKLPGTGMSTTKQSLKRDHARACHQ